MYIHCWGTRGSLPRAMDEVKFHTILESLVEEAKDKGITDLDKFLSSCKAGEIFSPITYGGNTSCTEVGHGDQKFFIDMGSGFREPGGEALKAGEKEFHVFMTHMHWDHVMGMPFFTPVFIPGHKINIYHVHKNTPEFIRINFNGINFPIKWEQLGAEIAFHELKLYEKREFGDVTVTPFSLDHPAGSFGYRFDAAGKSLAIGVDGEYKRLTPKELGRDLEYFQNLDLLLFDAQYEMAELASRFDWGHCSPNIGIDLALREGIKTLLFTHHDPWSAESKLRRMFVNAEKYLKTQIGTYADQWEKIGMPNGPHIQMAHDGLRIEIGADS